MRVRHHPFAVLAIICCAIGACSDDKPAATDITTSVDLVPSDSSGGDTTPLPAVGGDVDCAALKDNLANLNINWQVVIGLTNSPSAEWAEIPLGSVDKFGDQVAAVTAALGSDADASAALSFMSGANDIVVRGLGGDAAAQADLTEYMGADIAANVSKQIPISIAFQSTGCD